MPVNSPSENESATQVASVASHASQKVDNSVVVVKGKTIQLTKAPCKRASRAGIPKEPSLPAFLRARETVQSIEKTLIESGRTLATSNDFAARATRSVNYKLTGKSPAPLTSGKITHLQTLKSRTVDSFNKEPGYLLCDQTTTLQHDRLAEVALRANAGSQAVTKRRETQGAANQTPRINCRSIGTCAASQCANASLAIAIAKLNIEAEGLSVRNVMGTTCIDPAKLAFATDSELLDLFSDHDTTFLPVVSTTELVYNANPTKLGTSCIRTAAIELSRRELDEHLISRTMYADPKLTDLCKSIGGGYEIDALWAAVVLVVFLSYDPRGRRVLATTKLTDIDLQTAYVLECYGRAEITRRVRLEEHQKLNPPSKRKKKKRKTKKNAQPVSDDENSNDEEEEEADVGDEAGAGAGQSTLTPDEIRTLGTKRRRASKSMSSASSCCDSYSVLNWWFRALRSNQSDVLETLIASSRDTARRAAQKALHKQAAGNAEVAKNRTLNHISMSTAVKSCEELVRLVHQSVKDIPMIVCMKTAWEASCVGILPVVRCSNTSSIHACTIPVPSLQPHRDSRIVVLHSSATQEFASRNVDSNSNSMTPGIAERYTRLGNIRSSESTSSSAVEAHALNRLQTYIQGETRRPLLSSSAGMTRSLINFRITVPINQSTLDAGSSLAKEAVECESRSSQTYRDGVSNINHAATPIETCSTSQQDDMRREPLCTPCSRLGVGIRINELLRRWLVGRSRKNGINLVSCGLSSVDDIAKDLPLIMDSEPLPMAIITDFSTRASEHHTVIDASEVKQRGYCHATVGASLHVCLDGAVRVPEMVLQLDDMFEQRSMLLSASSQASYIGDVGSALSAQWANCSSASSKKVSCADVNTLMLLSHWDVYAGGLTNVHRNYHNTVFSGTYGPHIDTGITPPGLLAIYYKADKRQHGTMSLSQEAADEICEAISKSHFVKLDDDRYGVTPAQTRGIPHGFVPGVHSVMNDLVSSLESARKITDRVSEPTVDGLFSLPFSPFTQALAPDVEATVDLTIRHAFRDPSQCSATTGRSYLSDSTSEESAIFVEPMWRRPCQVCSLDNPFATSYGNADTMFNAANLLAGMVITTTERFGQLGKATSDARLDAFHELMCRAIFLDVDPCDESHHSPSYMWVSDALVLIFGVIYPCSHAINEDLVPAEISTLASKMNKHCRKQMKNGERPVGVPISKLLLPENVEKVQTAWSKFSKRDSALCAWKSGLRPLLRLLIDQRGSHELPIGRVAEFRKAVDDIPRSAYLVYSLDGVAPPVYPNPLWQCSSPQDVQRTHLDPVFCAMGDDLEIDPRGALVGIQPFQLRQIYALMLGSHFKSVRPQAVRNEGGLSLRMSSAADILEKDGSQRSEKAIAPLQIESDMDAFGVRNSKLYGCLLQRSAWDSNARLLKPLFAKIDSPGSKEKRSRGEWGDASWLQQYLVDEQEKNGKIHDVERLARNQLELACRESVSRFKWAL